MKKMISVMLALGILSGALAGCGAAKTETNPAQTQSVAAGAGEVKETDKAKEADKEELTVIRAAVMPQQLGLPLYYISKNGWDVENGFKLELTTFQSGAPMNEALGAGLWDVATIGAAGVLSCSVYDAVHILSHEDSSGGIDFMIRPDSEIASVKGYNPDYPDVYGSPETIKNAMFMFPIGSGHHLLLGEYLKIMGLNEEDISMVNMDHAEGYQAFVSGQGDVSATAYPTTDTYLEEGYISAVNMNTAKCPYYDNIVVNRKFYEDSKGQEALVALLTQMLRCADEFQDEEALLDAMVEWYQVNGQEVEREGIRNQVLERPFLTVADYKSSDTTASFRRMAEFFASIDKITQEDLEKVLGNIKPELLEQAIEKYEAQ